MIRPESLRLEANGAGGPGTVRGVVEEAVYLGGFRRYTVRINSREVLIARLPNQADTRRLGMGSPVQVSWEPQDLRLL